MRNQAVFEEKLKRASVGGQGLPSEGLFGVERECLRVDRSGTLAQTPQPEALGEAVSNPSITTDYAEPMLEFITRPHQRLETVMQELSDLTQFVYQNLDEEWLWPQSMPCVLGDEATIPIAQYGPSAQGQFKHLYRVGLAHRYGRSMQVISGVHFNMSFDERLWSLLYPKMSEPEARNHGYFVALRNLQRIGWIVPYLFGASPAACRSVAKGRATSLSLYNESTLIGPTATSLRLGDVGYNNADKRGYTFKANYDRLDRYLDSLLWAVKTPREEFEKIGLCGAEGRRQISTSHLQIENEYYASVRPKQVTRSGESPLQALRERGVAYLELRSLDVNPWCSEGVDLDTLRVLECLIWSAVLGDEAPLEENEQQHIEDNWRAIAHFGREAQVQLEHEGERVSAASWAQAIEEQLSAVAQHLSPEHQQAIARYVTPAVRDPAQTFSAKWLQYMQGQGGFFETVMNLAKSHADDAKTKTLSKAASSAILQDVENSRDAAAKLAEGSTDLDAYIAAYCKTWDA